MADSTGSSANNLVGQALRCTHCLGETYEFRKGWKMRFGKYANLCSYCSSVYKKGKFCEYFHGIQDGWRQCTDCSKALHCGCVMSIKQYVFLDDAQGVKCKKCYRTEMKMKQIQNQEVVQPQPPANSTQANPNN